MGKFEIYKNKSGEYRFRLKASNGQTILASEGYTTKAARDNGIESVRKNSQDENRFVNGVSKSDQPYFNLTATNGQVIGKSEMYKSIAARDNGIESVMKNAPDAEVVES
ncbi:YegP family protein [uncultured Nonlabens sp.]|uniref:YegP family protein n=1 Tax=uncultured Nonlabens sp. TaxID=859306 RepID=UPI002612F05D|nr:YegP family protein [uncultured Nonlabens sp.]